MVLRKIDWEGAKTSGETSILQSEMMRIQGELLVGEAVKQLKKFPETTKKED